jgi:pimeloyl-ACP methyl ester carboxylesterase
MAGDVARLLDHLAIPSADYLGYSMGARIGLEAVIAHPDRVRRAVLGGIGAWGRGDRADLIARRMRGDEGVTDEAAETFYRFAVARPINDLEALACCILGPQSPLSEADLAGIAVPVAIMAGDRDPIAAGAPEMAAAIPGAHHVAIAGRNHMNAVPARQFKEATLAFLHAPGTAGRPRSPAR